MYGVMIGYAFASLGKATRLPYENVGGIAVCLSCVGTELYKALFHYSFILTFLKSFIIRSDQWKEHNEYLNASTRCR